MCVLSMLIPSIIFPFSTLSPSPHLCFDYILFGPCKTGIFGLKPNWHIGFNCILILPTWCYTPVTWILVVSRYSYFIGIYHLTLLMVIYAIHNFCFVVNLSFKKISWAGCWWLTPEILAIQEAEIQRLMIQSQPRQIVWGTVSQENLSQKKGWWSSSRCRPWVQTSVPPSPPKKKKISSGFCILIRRPRT
jgi:hypothetical protein